MKRIFLFLVTNLAVLALLAVVLWIIESALEVRLGQGGLGGLLAMAAVFGFGGIGFFVAILVAQLVLGVLASLIVSWYSGRREFRADRGGANLAGTGGMIGALEALKRSQGEPMPPQMQAFGINTGDSGGWMRLFMSHPPLDARIAALRTAAAQETL